MKSDTKTRPGWCKAWLPVLLLMTVMTGLHRLATAQTYTMKLSTPTINDMQHEWAKVFKAELEKRTNGRIRVQVFPASQLGPIPTVLEGLQLGSVEATTIPFEFYAGIDPRLQITAIPGLFRDNQDARAKMADETIRKRLFALGVDKGIVGIGAAVYGPQFIASRKPLARLVDLSRQKIRVLASETEIGVLSALGASPTPMPLNEVTIALQQGTVDGVNSILDVMVAFGIADMAPNGLDMALWHTVVLTSVSKVWMDALPADLQQAIYETAAREMARYQGSRQRWLAAGGNLVRLSAPEQAQAQALTAQVTQKFLAQNEDLRELYDFIQQAK